MGKKENKALELLTTQLCKATMEPMQIVDFNKSYVIEVDSSGNTIGAVLLQLMLEQGNKPVKNRLTPTQKSWSTIDKEAFAAIWALNKLRN